MVLIHGNFGHWGTFNDVWRHFWSPSPGGAAGIWWIDARDATEHPTMHIPPQQGIIQSPKLIAPRLRKLVLNNLERKKNSGYNVCRDVG